MAIRKALAYSKKHVVAFTRISKQKKKGVHKSRSSAENREVLDGKPAGI